jgi:hypothetical protein
MKQRIFFHIDQINNILILMLLVPLLLLISFLPIISPLITAQTTSVVNNEEYENLSFGFSVDYPSNWIINEFEKRIKNDDIVGINNIVLFCPNHNTLNQVPSSTQLNHTGTKCTNPEKSFDIYLHNIPSEMTLEEFTNSKISSYKLELTDFEILDSNPRIVIDDIPAYKLTYAYTDKSNNDKKVQIMEVWTVINDIKDRDDLEDHIDKAYSLRYEALPIEFPIYMNTANSTIGSFEFKNINDEDEDNNDK